MTNVNALSTGNKHNISQEINTTCKLNARSSGNKKGSSSKQSISFFKCSHYIKNIFVPRFSGENLKSNELGEEYATQLNLAPKLQTSYTER